VFHKIREAIKNDEIIIIQRVRFLFSENCIKSILSKNREFLELRTK
jgi:hypothetical protein